MIEIEINGSIYQGRLLHILALPDKFNCPDGKIYYKNSAYQVRIMDANGVTLEATIDRLDRITFVG